MLPNWLRDRNGLYVSTPATRERARFWRSWFYQVAGVAFGVFVFVWIIIAFWGAPR